MYPAIYVQMTLNPFFSVHSLVNYIMLWRLLSITMNSGVCSLMVFMIPGEGERYDTCADVIGWYKCPSCGFNSSMVTNCSRVVCP